MQIHFSWHIISKPFTTSIDEVMYIDWSNSSLSSDLTFIYYTVEFVKAVQCKSNFRGSFVSNFFIQFRNNAIQIQSIDN